jgi:hypothetical protein
MHRKLAAFILMAGVALGRAVDIVPPQGWQRQINTPPTVELLFALPTAKGEFSPNLAVSRYKLPCCKEGKTSVDSLMKQVKGNQERSFPLYKVVEKRKRKIGGIDGAYFLTTYARGEIDAAALQYFFLQGEDFVNVVYTCLVKDLPRFQPEFEKSLATLKSSSAADSMNTRATQP